MGKDANDVLQELNKAGYDQAAQIKLVKEALAAADPLVVVMAKWTGSLKGAEQDRALVRLFQVIGKMDKALSARYRGQLCEILKMGIRDFNNMQKAAQGEKEKDEAAPELLETLGGFVDGWLIEYVYDAESDSASFAYRDPDGRIGCSNYIDIGLYRYVPKSPNALIRNKGVLFPSKLGEKKSTKELVSMVEAFIHQHYLLDDRFFARMAAYYVLLTWVYDSFNAIPYLRAEGDYGSGKSQLMMRIGHICYRLMVTSGSGSGASLYRGLEMFKGTAFMDEMDLRSGGDMTNDVIKILNTGNTKGTPVWKCETVTLPDGSKSIEVATFNTYGPKLIAMRGKFEDDATESRCLTVRLMGKEPMELRSHGIKLHLDEEFYAQAQAMRNLLLRWRLEKWQPEIRVGEELMDLQVPARLNQVTMPLKAIAKDDPELMRDIVTFVRALNDELVLERSMGKDARVLDALVAIREKEAYKHYLMEGDIGGLGEVQYVLTKHVAKVANEVMDEMNIAEEDEEGEPTGADADTQDTKKVRKRGGITSQTVGKVARNTLQLKCHRMNNGYVVIYDEQRIKVLKVRYGLAKAESLGVIENE